MAVNPLPLVGVRRRLEGGRRDRVRRRADREGVQDQRLRVALPAVAEEAALGGPPHRDRLALVHRPLPVDGVVEGVGAVADLRLVRVVGVVEEGGGAEEARDQERRVDGRQLARPGAAAVHHVEEVVEEAPVPDAVLRAVLGRVAEEADRRERDLAGGLAGHPPPRHSDGQRREAEADRRDRRGAVGHGAVHDEPVRPVRLAREVGERGTVDGVEQVVGSGGVGHGRRRSARRNGALRDGVRWPGTGATAPRYLLQQIPSFSWPSSPRSPSARWPSPTAWCWRR